MVNASHAPSLSLSSSSSLSLTLSSPPHFIYSHLGLHSLTLSDTQSLHCNNYSILNILLTKWYRWSITLCKLLMQLIILIMIPMYTHMYIIMGSITSRICRNSQCKFERKDIHMVVSHAHVANTVFVYCVHIQILQGGPISLIAIAAQCHTYYCSNFTTYAVDV